MRLGGEVCDTDSGCDGGANVYLDLWMTFVGKTVGMSDRLSDGDGEDDVFEVATMTPVGDIGEIGEPDDPEGILIKLGVVTVGDIGEESNSDGAVVVEKSDLASLSVGEEFVEKL